jgi:GNAT superfamily N-acetyltransferase
LNHCTTMLIRVARPLDAADLPRIEKSAAQLFRTEPDLAWLAAGPVMAPSEHERLILKQAVWVAEAGPGDLVGFLDAEVVEDELHLWELSVHQAWQRRGIGKELLLSAHSYALEQGLAALTLTTFRDVPWCAPAYAKLGFRPVSRPSERLQACLNSESSRGLAPAPRIAMQLAVGTLASA